MGTDWLSSSVNQMVVSGYVQDSEGEKNPVLLKSKESSQKLCVLIERTLDFPFMCTTSRIVLFLSGYTYHTATNRIFC